MKNCLQSSRFGAGRRNGGRVVGPNVGDLIDRRALRPGIR